MIFRIGKVPGKAQQIIRRDLKENAESVNIGQTGFIPIVLNIGNLSLGHIHSISQLCLIHFFVFTQMPDSLAKGEVHIHHHTQFTIDRNFLLHFRQ